MFYHILNGMIVWLKATHILQTRCSFMLNNLCCYNDFQYKSVYCLFRSPSLPNCLFDNLCCYNAPSVLDNFLKYLKLGEIDMIFWISEVSALLMVRNLFLQGLELLSKSSRGSWSEHVCVFWILCYFFLKKNGVCRNYYSI